MTITYRVDAARSLVEVAVSGQVSPGDYAEYLRAVASDPTVRPEYDTIVDFSALDLVPDPGVIRRMAVQAARAADGTRPRRALVAPENATYEMMRMFRAYISAFATTAPIPEFEVFHSLEEARTWLRSAGGRTAGGSEV